MTTTKRIIPTLTNDQDCKKFCEQLVVQYEDGDQNDGILILELSEESMHVLEMFLAQNKFINEWTAMIEDELENELYG